MKAADRTPSAAKLHTTTSYSEAKANELGVNVTRADQPPPPRPEDRPKPSAATASPSAHQIAYGILVAAHGEREADDIWNEWTPAERAVVASAAERFRPTLTQAAADLVAWLRSG